jgi:hypothetical protein
MARKAGRAPIAPDSPGQARNDALSTVSRTLSPAAQRQRGQAALKHGLRANSSQALRVRSYRTGRLLTRLQVVLAESGRPLKEAEVSAARAWCQMEVLATDYFAALQVDLFNDAIREHYNSTRRTQLLYAKELGLTPNARANLAATAGHALGLAAQLAQRRAALESK